MSVLANETYEYLKKTGRQIDKYQLQTKFQVNNQVMTDAIIELGTKLSSTRLGSHRVYWVPKPTTAERVATSIFKPYKQPSTLTQRQREIEAQRAEFPSKFHD
jgi:hypothetical protein